MIRLCKPHFPKETMLAIEEVLESGWVAGGEKAEKFAQKIADLEGYRYGVATNSCTSALIVAMETYPFDKHIIDIPNITYPATINAVLLAGYEPRIISNWNRMALDMGVDLLGYKENQRWAWSIADAACSLGSKNMYREDNPDVACYSFHPRKLITTGEGGCICTDNDVLYERMHDMVYQGGPPTFGVGYNMRLSDLNAVVGLVQLDYLDLMLDRRWERAKWYNEMLPECVEIWGQKDREVNKDYNYQSFTVVLSDGYSADEVVAKLKVAGVEATHGTFRLGDLDVYRDYVSPFEVFDDPNLLTLPLRYDMAYDETEAVCEELEAILK